MSMEKIEGYAQAYADAREHLTDEVRALQDEMEQAKRDRLNRIKHALAEERSAHDELRHAVVEARPLFATRRTRVLHGIKVGWVKQPGKLAWTSTAKVVDRIHEQMPERVEALLKVSETPVKKALQQLDSKELRRLGITIEDTGDTFIIKPVDSAVDKLIDALLSDVERLDEETPA